jgi:hypothetical protein
MTTAEIPMPCWPLDCLTAWNLEPYRSLPNTLGIWCFRIPGPLSSTAILYSHFEVSSISINIVGSIIASSQASSELSTASFTAVIKTLVWLSKPRICLFLSKNSATEISFCSLAILSAIDWLNEVPPLKSHDWNRSSSKMAFLPSALFSLHPF